MIDHVLQIVNRAELLQSWIDERDSIFDVSPIAETAYRPRAYGKAWRRLAKTFSEGDSV